MRDVFKLLRKSAPGHLEKSTRVSTTVMTPLPLRPILSSKIALERRFTVRDFLIIFRFRCLVEKTKTKTFFAAKIVSNEIQLHSFIKAAQGKSLIDHN